MTTALRIPLCLLCLGFVAAPDRAWAQGASTYVVLLVTTHDGKMSHKAIADKEQAAFRKTVEEEYQKARRAFQEEKKASQKDKTKKVDRPEPQKPRFQVVKKDIKSFNEARKAASELDRALAE